MVKNKKMEEVANKYKNITKEGVMMMEKISKNGIILALGTIVITTLCSGAVANAQDFTTPQKGDVVEFKAPKDDVYELSFDAEVTDGSDIILKAGDNTYTLVQNEDGEYVFEDGQKTHYVNVKKGDEVSWSSNSKTTKYSAIGAGILALSASGALSYGLLKFKKQ